MTLAETSPLGPGGTEVAFQDYFVRLRHDVVVRGVRFEGEAAARPAPGVMEALEQAETRSWSARPIRSSPSLPCWPCPACREALVARRDRVVAVSPIVAGSALKGPADRLMAELGTEASVVGVAKLYAPWVATLVVDTADAARVADVEAQGVRCVVTPTVMTSPERAADLARVVLDARG